MQAHSFSTGGFVVHRIPQLGGTGHISGWFNADGTMIDAELFMANGRARPLKYRGPLWMHAQSVGSLYAARAGVRKAS